MITDKDIQRINELYHKSKTEGLTPEEKEEQAASSLVIAARSTLLYGTDVLITFRPRV